MDGKKLFGGLTGILLGTALVLSPTYAQNIGPLFEVNKKETAVVSYLDPNMLIPYNSFEEWVSPYKEIKFSQRNLNPEFNSNYMAFDSSGFALNSYYVNTLELIQDNNVKIVIEDYAGGENRWDIDLLPDNKIETVKIFMPNGKNFTLSRNNPFDKKAIQYWQSAYDFFTSKIPGVGSENI